MWEAWCEGCEVFTKYGTEGGKMQVKSYTAKPTNIGRSNEHTAEQQAQAEVESLYHKQQDSKHYKTTIGAAQEDADKFIPMQLQNYKKHASKINFPCFVQRKFNGSRRTYYNGKFLSKIGREEDNKLERLTSELESLGWDLDGEVYAHGLSLQKIRSAALKPNNDTDKLKLVVFDVPLRGTPFFARAKLLNDLKLLCEEYDTIDVEIPTFIIDEGELQTFFDKAIKDGYEGVVVRNTDSDYECKRSYNTQKWKPRYDAEAKVVGVEECKNGDGKLLCVSSEALGNVKFKVMMKVDRRDGKSYDRSYEAMTNYVGEWITFSYEELSDKGVPTKPVGELVRKCNEKGEPNE